MKADGYQNWLEARTACTLLYTGGLGSGKSVLLANIVDDLYLRNDADSIVAYSFCRNDVEESLIPVTIIGCLARQVLVHLPKVDSFEEMTEKSSTSFQFDMDKLTQLIKKYVTKPVRFILDGIDDIDSIDTGRKQELLNCIYHLQQSIPLLICMSSRLPQDVFRGTTGPEHLLMASMPRLNADIKAYVESEINHRLADRRLVISDTKLIQEVKQKLINKSEGMFLWVYLQIVHLCSMESDFDVRQALKGLPQGVTDTCQYSLPKCDTSWRDRQLLQTRVNAKSESRLRLFELILVACEPLRSEEIREALSVERGNMNYDPSKLVNSLDSIISSAAGLVVVDEEETTVRLVHFSVHQFLTSSVYEDVISESTAQSKMAEVILTYLNFSIFESRMTVHSSRTMSSTAIPAAILISTAPMLSRFIRVQQIGDKDGDLGNAGTATMTSNSCFKRYALSYWDKHLMAVEQTESCLCMLDIALSKGRIDINIEHDQLTPLQRAVEKRWPNVIAILLRHGVAKVDHLAAVLGAECCGSSIIDMLVKDYDDYGQLFHEAIVHNIIALMMSLLRLSTSEVLNRSFSTLGDCTPLAFATDCQSETMVRPLSVDPKIDPNMKCSKHGEESFYYAVRSGNSDILELLMNKVSQHRYDQRKLWKPATHQWSKLVDEQARKVLYLLLRRNFLDLRYDLIAPNRFATGYSAGLYPLIVASQHNALTIVAVMLNVDATIVNGVQSTTSYSRDILLPPVITQKTACDMTSDSTVRSLLLQYGCKQYDGGKS